MKPSGLNKTQFFRDLFKNLGLLLVIGIILFIGFPGLMRQVFQVYGGLFAPALIVLLILVAAPPRKRWR